MRIEVPAGRTMRFLDADGKPLTAPESLHLARAIELPDADLYAPKPETPAQVVANRVGVTGALFAIAVGAAVALGRSRP